MKTQEQNVKFVQTFFYQPLRGSQPPEGHWEPRKEVGSQSLNEGVGGIRA